MRHTARGASSRRTPMTNNGYPAGQSLVISFYFIFTIFFYSFFIHFSASPPPPPPPPPAGFSTPTIPDWSSPLLRTQWPMLFLLWAWPRSCCWPVPSGRSCPRRGRKQTEERRGLQRNFLSFLFRLHAAHVSFRKGTEATVWGTARLQFHFPSGTGGVAEWDLRRSFPPSISRRRSRTCTSFEEAGVFWLPVTVNTALAAIRALSGRPIFAMLSF